METFEKIVKRVREAREAYYNLDPVMSDSEYDILLTQLKSMDPNHEELRRVGSTVIRNTPWDKIRHEIPMGSLNKIHTREELEQFTMKFGIKEWFITHKFDGISLECVYERGELIQSVTRGDGYVGENVFDNVIHVHDVPRSISYKGRLSVRGEFMIFKDNFARHFSGEYSNPRNTASGVIRDFKAPSLNKLEHFAFVAYDTEPTIHHTMVERITWLKDMGFRTPEVFNYGDLGTIIDFYNAQNGSRNQLEYEIDGCVVSPLNIEDSRNAGFVNLRPEASVAWKFEAATAITKVRDVRWTVGPTGRVTPVAIVDPINIGGVVITNVSLQNLGIFRELALSSGCNVVVSRKNDVIPYLQANLDLV